MGVEFFGQFLLRRRVIRREQLLEAIALQEAENAPLGQYAVRLGFLTKDDCDRILSEQQRNSRRFGEIAVELGLLSSSQIDELITRQKNDHLFLGDALLKLGHIDPVRLTAELSEFNQSQRQYQTHEEVVFPTGTDPDPVVGIVVGLTRGLLSRVLGTAVDLADGRRDPTFSMKPFVTVSLIFEGDGQFGFALSLSSKIAETLAMKLLGCESVPTPQMVVDSLSEILNIACGDACARYAQIGKRLAISTPRVGVPEGLASLYFAVQTPIGMGEIRIYS